MERVICFFMEKMLLQNTDANPLKKQYIVLK